MRILLRLLPVLHVDQVRDFIRTAAFPVVANLAEQPTPMQNNAGGFVEKLISLKTDNVLYFLVY